MQSNTHVDHGEHTGSQSEDASDTEQHELELQVSDNEQRLDSQSKQLDALRDEFHEFQQVMEAERAQLESEAESLATELEAARERIREVESRTNMLRLVEEADDLDYKQRRMVLLQHLEREAQAKADNPDEAVQNQMKASLTHENAERVLHYPEIDRTTLYNDMEKAAKMVGDKRVCKYENGQLTLNLEQTENGELPAAVVDTVNGS